MQIKKQYIKRLLLGIVGIFLVGIGVSFNAAAALGNDPVGIVYDGIRNAAHMSPGQLGMTSNIVNLVLIFIIFLSEKRYVSIGTVIHLLTYGNAVSFGGMIYESLFDAGSVSSRIAAVILGCILLYTGVAMFITADIGLDPFTGLVMVLRDKTKKEFRIVKITFDLGCILLGTILGGKLGIITVVTAITAGPAIQFLTKRIQRFVGMV